MDAGEPITVLAGVHPGCFELFANERIRSIIDLKGKSVGVQGIGSTPHVFLAVMATYVGLDPVNDINWVTSPSVRPKELFVEGKIDAFLGFPPEPQELRARKIGHVIVNSAVDRPWSQYFCCMLAGNTDFVDQHPIATKRVAARHPQGRGPLRRPSRSASRSSWSMAGSRSNYDYALQSLHRGALREVAGLRSRGHAPVLCAAPARGRHDQVEPARRSSPTARTGASSNELKRELKT